MPRYSHQCLPQAFGCCCLLASITLLILFPSIADHYEWLCAPFCRCQSVGIDDESKVGVTWLLSSSYKFPCVSNHTGTTEHPFSGGGIVGHWEVLMGHGIPSNGAKHCCWSQEVLWSHHGLGTSLPSPLSNSRGGSPQTCAAGWWECGLVICICPAKWGPIPWSLKQQGPCQHHDIQCTLWGSLWLPPPAAGMQTIVAQRHGGVPRRSEWQVRSLTVYFPGASHLGCHHPGKPAHEPQLIEVDLSNMQPESITTISQAPQTPPVLPPSPADTTQPPGYIAAAINLQLSGTLVQLQQVSLSPQHPSSSTVHEGDSHLWWPWGLHPHLEKKISWGQRGWIPSLLTQWQPHTDVSMGDHTRWHPQLCTHHSPTAPADCPKDTRGGKHAPHHTASDPLQGWTSQPIRWASSATGEI